MLLRQLAIHVQKNEVGPLLHITYKKKKESVLNFTFYEFYLNF